MSRGRGRDLEIQSRNSEQVFPHRTTTPMATTVIAKATRRRWDEIDEAGS